MSALPVHVIAGPLGVGKTTAVKRLIAGMPEWENVAVIVNDFGKAGLDAEVLRAGERKITVENIPGGCLCCSSSLDIRSAIETLMQNRSLTRIIIEPSGLVILPDFVPSLKRLCEAFHFNLRPVIVLLNPRRTKESHYKAMPFFATLVDYADILIANRIDECTEEHLQHFREWTRNLNPPKLLIRETSFGHAIDEIILEVFDQSNSPRV